MERDEARRLARAYLESTPLPHPYRWVVTDPVVTASGWMFEFEFTCDADIPPSEWEHFAGAPAFVVTGDGSVDVLSWDRYREHR